MSENKAQLPELISYFGFMKNCTKINEDVLDCSSAEAWEANDG